MTNEQVRQDILSKLPKPTREFIKQAESHLKKKPKDFKQLHIIRRKILSNTDSTEGKVGML